MGEEKGGDPHGHVPWRTAEEAPTATTEPGQVRTPDRWEQPGSLPLSSGAGSNATSMRDLDKGTSKASWRWQGLGQAESPRAKGKKAGEGTDSDGCH